MRGTIVERKPATRAAYLPNCYGDVTLHVFDRAELRTLRPGERGVSMIYRCTETGEMRQWGLEYTSEELIRLGVVR
jgi:hypothetical protein